MLTMYQTPNGLGGPRKANALRFLFGSFRSRLAGMRRCLVTALFLGILAIGSSNLASLAIQNGDYPSTSSQASSQIAGFPASNGIDADMSSAWSSNLYADPNHTEWYAFWFGGFKTVNYLRLTPRISNGAAAGFPQTFTVYWSDGTNWNAFPAFTNVPAPQFGDTVINLPSTVSCNGIEIVASVLGSDHVGNYVFQMADFRAGYSKPGKVYFGCADSWNSLNANPSQWTYVQQNADGFYVNFVEMGWLNGWIANSGPAVTQQTLNQTAALFSSKNAFFESDETQTSIANDQAAITSIQAAGFTIPYTSLNSGWSADHASNLMNYQNGTNKRRQTLVQCGPWNIGGDIQGDAGGGGGTPSNASYRSWAAQADGMSTDGPMGIWYNNVGGMQPGSMSVVKFSHGLHKTAMVMLCPYGAGQSGYSDSLFLSTGQSEVRAHENAGDAPDIWAVFEYSDSIAAVPEQSNGQAVNTSSGMAYWLIHHLQDPAHYARLDIVPQHGVSVHTAKGSAAKGRETELCSADLAVPAVQTSAHAHFINAVFTGDPGGASERAGAAASLTFSCLLHNDSKDMDFCPVVRAKLDGHGGHWTARCTLDGQDVTRAMTTEGGLVCVGAQRLLPKSKHVLKIMLTSTVPASTADLTLDLMPHPTRMDEIHQHLVFHAKS